MLIQAFFPEIKYPRCIRPMHMQACLPGSLSAEIKIENGHVLFLPCPFSTELQSLTYLSVPWFSLLRLKLSSFIIRTFQLNYQFLKWYFWSSKTSFLKINRLLISVLTVPQISYWYSKFFYHYLLTLHFNFFLSFFQFPELV